MRRILATAITLLLFQGLCAYAQTHFERMNHGLSTGPKDRDSVVSPAENERPAGNQREVQMAARDDRAETKEQKAEENRAEQPSRQKIQKVSSSAPEKVSRQSNVSSRETGERHNNAGMQGSSRQLTSADSGAEMRIKRMKKSGKSADQINRENQGRVAGDAPTSRTQTKVRKVDNAGPVSRGNQGRAGTKSGVDMPRKVQIPEKVKKLGVTKLPPAFDRKDKILRVERQRSVISLPKAGPEGKPFTAKVVSPKQMSVTKVKTHMNLIVKDKNFHNQILHFNTSERTPKRYYWHTWNGHRYCHYYDHWGYHWYGWHVGPSFFWTRYYDNNWWWYDSAYDRWCYWYNGWWWWPHPTRVNVVYIYNNGTYTECDSEPIVTTAPITAGDDTEVIYRSKNGNRMVKITGDESDAFLYDTSGSPSFRAVYLASNVKKAKFSYRDGVLYQVVLLHYDGTYSLFDAEGYPYLTGNDDFE